MNKSVSTTCPAFRQSSNLQSRDNINDMNETSYNNADKKGRITGMGLSVRNTGILHKYDDS